MQTFGFVGASGTGKSYRSLYVAQKYNIKYIIDDGLLIDSKHVIAGRSAKREQTKVASIRRALFTEQSHCEEVKKAIEEESPDKLLILGTSEKMINHIADVLEVGPISDMIYIEEIATEEEITLAQKIRREQGKHVIPVPTFEIEKDFSGYFIDTLKIFLKYGKSQQDTFKTEKTVVRPTFSYMGQYHISNHVFTSLAKFESEKIAHVVNHIKTTVFSHEDGVVLNVELNVDLKQRMEITAKNVQKAVKESIEGYTSVNVIKVNVIIKTVEVNNGSKNKK